MAGLLAARRAAHRPIRGWQPIEESTIDPAPSALDDFGVTRSIRSNKFARLAGYVVVALSTGAAAAPGVADAEQPIQPEVQKAIAAAREAHGPERYTALRELWSLWDESDPAQVEAGLQSLSTWSTYDAPARAYAGLLSAYARRRRGDLLGAQDRIGALGFVRDWLVVGPFDNDGKSGFARAWGPELDLQQPLDIGRAYEGKERPSHWRAIPDVTSYGWIDFGALLRPTEKICAYATTFVRSNAKGGGGTQASLWTGSSGAMRAFWNGEQVLSDPQYRSIDADRLATTVTVKPGWNRLTIKVCNDDSSPMLAVRLADMQGAPDPGLAVSSDPSHAQDAARNAVVRNGKRETAAVKVQGTGKDTTIEAPNAPPKRERDPGHVRGPIQQFETLTSRAQPRPEDLEAYARYLRMTGGDDPVERKARTLANRAADRAPTVRRLLLAGDLAEDRNQRRQWVDKAARAAGSQPDVDVLLAQAQLARTGANWRDAVPYYDQVLKLDPANTEALLGRVDLYNEAGLRRTALGMLERAVDRNPRSVSLLREYALQLGSLGRQTEAEEIQTRYASYRFDDPTMIVSRLETAVARRDKPLASHWIARLLDVSPDSPTHLAIAARSMLSLGETDAAIGLYQQALAMAPEDTQTMRELSDTFGELGRRDQQVQLLRRILVLRPQTKDVREYLESMEQRQQRADEAYAWSAERFLPLRTSAPNGFNRRTLRDLQVTTVFPSGLSSSFHQVVFQPLTDEAAASARQYAFSYQADSQVVQLRGARVYRSDGRIDEAIETDEGPADNPAIAMYTSARTFYVQFPRLNVGDVVELRYRIEDVSQENSFADYFGEVEYLQASEPVMNAEYVVIAPSSRPLYFDASPLPGLTRADKTDGPNRVYRFFAPSVAPLLPEPNMPPWSEVLGHVHVSTYRSWDQVGRWYWGLAKDQLVPDAELEQKTLELTKGLTTDADKVRAIYDFVVQRTRYVALEFGIYGFKPRRASQTYARGWGDCKDKAALIVSMLRVVGIPASMVIVRSQMRGDFPTDIASLAPFDHAIAYVPSLDLYLDGTAEYTGSTELPAFDRTSMALVVNEAGSKLVRLPDPPPSESVLARNLEATVQPDGAARIDMHLSTTGAPAAEWRMRYHSDSTRRDRVVRDVSRDLPGFELAPGNAAIETNDLENIEQPVQMHIQGKAPAFARIDDGDLSIPVTPMERFVPTYATQSQRRLDLRVGYQRTIDETWTVHVPAGVHIKSKPSATTSTTPYGTLEMSVSEAKGAVTVHTTIRLARSRIPAKDYPAFAGFCEQVDQALAQRLVVGR